MVYLKLLDYRLVFIFFLILLNIGLINASKRETPSQNYFNIKSLNKSRFNSSLKQEHFKKRVFRTKHFKCPSSCYCSHLSMSCTGRKLHKLPKFFNRKLEMFEMKSTRLSHIKKTDFSRMFSLYEMNLAENKMKWIDGWSFKDLINMEVLNLTSNRLHHLETTTFRHLVETKELYLDRNRLVNIEGALGYLANLVILGISHNKLRSISSKTFYGNSLVTKLDLSHNLIRFIDRNAFTRMTSLNTLLLNENPITELDLFLESNLLLEQLDLTHCNLKRVVRDTPSQLKDLRLSNNKIKEISESDFFNPKAVTLLLLSENRIENLSDYAFHYMPYLEDLHISKNRLKRLPLHMPKRLYSLHASHNRIQVLNSKLFRKMHRLKYIFLNFNNISRIESGTFKNLPRLKHIDISHNNIKEITSDLFWNTENLEILDLSFNPIHTFETNCFLSMFNLHIFKASSVTGSAEMDVSSFADLSNLQYLDLSYSPIIVFNLLASPSFGIDIASVQQLNIMDTGLSRLPHQIRDVMKNLSSVNMIHNPWRCDKNILWIRDWIRENNVNFYDASKIVCNFPRKLKDRKLLELSKEEVRKVRKKRKNKKSLRPRNDDFNEDINKFNDTLSKLEKYLYGITNENL